MMLGTEISMFSLSLSFTSWKKQHGNVMKMWLIICVLPLIWRDFRLITWIMDLWSNWFGCCQEGIQKDLESVLLSTHLFFFTGCWALIRLWLHEVTSNKIVFIKNEEHLAEYIPLHILPKPLFWVPQVTSFREVVVGHLEMCRLN